MIVVAHGGKSSADGIPMLLKIPRMFDPWGGYCVVGLGDLILPGLVIAFALRQNFSSGLLCMGHDVLVGIDFVGTMLLPV
ncbi:Signal peptide peptidase-like 2 [Ranunculus cassubicifolius]